MIGYDEDDLSEEENSEEAEKSSDKYRRLIVIHARKPKVD
jgi:hypothetical protein